MEVMKTMSRRTKIVISTILVCALAVTAAAVTVSILALSDRGERNDTDRAEEEPQDVREERQEKDGQEPLIPSEDGKTQTKQPEGSATTNYPGLVPMQVPASSVDEALLRQAAQEYAKNTLGDAQSYQITQIKISVMDPKWGKVTFFRQDQNLTLETLFLRQDGNWAPAQIGPGTPAKPTDI